MTSTRKRAENANRNPENQLIAASEYDYLVGKEIPNLAIAVTDKNGTKTIAMHVLLGNESFSISYQPGASTLEEVEQKRYPTKHGATGCSGEAMGIDKVCDKLAVVGYKNIFIANVKTSQQHQQVIQDRNINSVRLISDAQLALADALNLPINSDIVGGVKIEYPERVTFLGKNKKIEKVIAEIEKPAENFHKILLATEPKWNESLSMADRDYLVLRGIESKKTESFVNNQSRLDFLSPSTSVVQKEQTSVSMLQTLQRK